MRLGSAFESADEDMVNHSSSESESDWDGSTTSVDDLNSNSEGEFNNNPTDLQLDLK